MRGVVRRVSTVNGFAAVETEPGEYTVVEPLGGEFDEGEVVEGNLHALGGEMLTKLATGERVSVFIQDIRTNAAGAGALLSAP